MLKNILIAADIDRSFEERAAGDARFAIMRRPVRTEEELAAIVGDAQILATRAYNKVTRRVMEAAPRLELIAQGTSGIDNVDLEAARERGVEVIHMPGVNADAVAELVIGFMISLTRTVPQYTRDVARGVFHRDDCATRHELHHFRLGIIGLGHVGTRVARLANVFGMRVEAFDPYVADAKASSLEALLRGSDIVSLHVPLTSETRKMIGAREIGMLPRGSYLINASRGEVLDQDAAFDAVQRDHLAGIALDVFDPEPPAAALPDDPRIILTPHIGGCSYEVKTTVGGQLFTRIAEHYDRRERRP